MKNLKMFVFAGVAAVSVVIIRCIQIIFLTDAATGFYVDGLGSLGTLLSVFITLIIAFAAWLSFFVRDTRIDLIPKSSLILGVAALLAGVSHIVEPITSTGNFGSSVPSLLLPIRIIMIITAGIAFCYFGVCFILGLKPKHPVSVVFAVAWIARLMSTFISFTGMSNISENMYDVAMLIATLVFFLVHSKALCGIEQRQSLLSTFVMGTISCLLTMVSALPSVIVSVLGTTDVAHTPTDSPVTCFFTAVYIAVYLINISKRDNESLKN